jgi:hypothetical protein
MRALSRCGHSSSVLAIFIPLPTLAALAQDLPIGATFICNGEHIYVENCNIRDTSDTSTCMVAHPDHLTPTGLNSYTHLTRAAGTRGTTGTRAAASSGGGLSTPQAPLGNAVLTVASGFPAHTGVPNPLAGRPYVLLRFSYGDTLANAGAAVPSGTSPYKYVAALCGNQSPNARQR